MLFEAMVQEPVPNSRFLSVSDSHTEVMLNIRIRILALEAILCNRKLKRGSNPDLLQELSGLAQT